MPRLRLAFMGTAAFALPSLAALVEAGHEIACVYTRPPRPAGRGLGTRPSPVHAFADRRGLALRAPASLKEAGAFAAFAALGVDAAVVAAYGLLLPAAALAAPRLGCLNLHPSLLPRWRGAAPIQRAIMAGDAETGVTVMRMDEGLDTGDALLVRRVAIDAGTTGGALHDSLAELGARAVVETLAGLDRGRLRPVPQPAAGATYAAKIGPGDRALDWRRPAAALERQVRALTPRPGAWFACGGERVRAAAAAAVPAAAPAAPGAVLDEALTVACGEGALRLLRVQRQGRREMDAAAFLRGFDLPPGRVLPSPGAAPA